MPWLTGQNLAEGVLPQVLSYIQKIWLSPVYTKIQSKISETTTALLNGVSAPGASDWLNAVPSSTNGLRLESRQFQIAAGLRLGASVCTKHTCVCGSQVEASGNHALVCAKLKGRHMRHRLANDIVKHSFATAELPSTLEPSGLCISNAKRPDGLTLLPYSRGKALVWDFILFTDLQLLIQG